jgi:hypothetical protein
MLSSSQAPEYEYVVRPVGGFHFGNVLLPKGYVISGDDARELELPENTLRLAMCAKRLVKVATRGNAAGETV